MPRPNRAWSVSCTLALVLLTCCKEEKHASAKLQEVIEVEGQCWEDHVGQRSEYVGEIFRSTSQDGERVYGIVQDPIAASPERIKTLLAANPGEYFPPQSITLTDFAGTDGETISARGLSEFGESGPSYASTCSLIVTGRGSDPDAAAGRTLKKLLKPITERK